MILRRITQHVNAQNWTAVALDFFIVVVGVFVGLQVANWNDARGDKAEYKLALYSLAEEANANLDVLDKIEAQARKDLSDATLGLDALRSCENSTENVELIETGLLAISGTSTIHLQTSALEALTTSPSLLAEQAPELRRAFSATKFKLEVLKAEADYSESLPFRDRPESNPAVGIGDLAARTYSYHGVDTSRSFYPLNLAKPISEICDDNQLLKSFYTWYRFQAAIPAYSARMRAEMQNILDAVGPLTQEKRR